LKGQTTVNQHEIGKLLISQGWERVQPGIWSHPNIEGFYSIKKVNALKPIKKPPRMRSNNRQKEKALILDILQHSLGPLNSYELRHQYLHWMSSSEINGAAKQLEKEGLVTRKVVDAPFTHNGIAQFKPPKITVWELTPLGESIEEYPEE
jgi:hypothetical protein